VPITIGNVGVFEGSLAFALTRHGLAAEKALAVATLEHCAKFAGLLLCVALLGSAFKAGRVRRAR
jgi:hypothetical protein